MQSYMSSVQKQRETVVKQYASSMDSGSTSGHQTPSSVVPQGSHAFETSNLWEEWTQASNGDDTVSSSNFLPEISSFTSSRLSFQQSDSLTTWMSGFPPLSQTCLSPDLSNSSDPVDHPPAFIPEGLGPGDSILDYSPALTEMYPRSSSKHNSSDCLAYPAASTADKKLADQEVGSAISIAHDRGSVSRQLLRVLGPLSPSSPLALQNGQINPLRDPWDASPSAIGWPSASSHAYGPGATRASIPDHSANAINHLEGIAPLSSCQPSKPRHTDIFIAPNGTFDSTPGGWTPQFYDGSMRTDSSIKAMKLMASLREAGQAEAIRGFCSESKPSYLRGGDRTTPLVNSFFGKAVGSKSGMKQTWSGKHPLEIEEIVDCENRELNPTQLKRSKLSENHPNALWSDHSLKTTELRSYSHLVGSSLNASQAMDIIAIGPALNTNGKPRAKRGSATDPQSVYARHRREKINERLKNLQNLVPNGAKVDIVTMLDEAIHYVKFLQKQVELLKSDELWIYATPNKYNGMDISGLSDMHLQELESSA